MQDRGRARGWPGWGRGALAPPLSSRVPPPRAQPDPPPSIPARTYNTSDPSLGKCSLGQVPWGSYGERVAQRREGRPHSTALQSGKGTQMRPPRLVETGQQRAGQAATPDQRGRISRAALVTRAVVTATPPHAPSPPASGGREFVVPPLPALRPRAPGRPCGHRWALSQSILQHASPTPPPCLEGSPSSQVGHLSTAG